MSANTMSIRTKMLIGFLAISLIPIILLAVTAMIISGNAMSSQVFGQLESLRDIKKNQVQYFIEERKSDLGVLIDTVDGLRQAAFDRLRSVQENKKAHVREYFQQTFSNIDVISKSIMVNRALRDFESVIDSRGNFDTRLFEFFENVKYGQSLREFKDEYGYHDLLLITRDGDVVYSALRESDLGQNLMKGPLKDTGIARCFRNGLNGPHLADFEPHAPSDNRHTAFLSSPIRETNGKVLGVVLLKLTNDAINKIVNRREGMGETGETYIVSISNGQAGYRSQRIVKTGGIGDLAVDEHLLDAVTAPVGPIINIGTTGTSEIVTYDPLNIPGLDWVIATSLDLEEVIDPRLNAREKDYFNKYVQSYGYDNLFLISADGLVFYSALHGEEHQTNVRDENPVNLGLARLFEKVMESKSMRFVDFDLFGTNADLPTAFIGQPLIIDDRIEMVAALRLPIERFNEIMRSPDALGKTGETYLVGPEGLLRSNSDLEPEKFSVSASFLNPGKRRIQTIPVTRAIAGETGNFAGPDFRGVQVLSAYTPLPIMDATWALIAEIDKKEAFASLHFFLFLALAGSIVAACAIIGFSIFFSQRFSSPILSLTAAAEQVKARNFDISVDIHSNDEIQLLGEAFNAMVVKIREYSDSLLRNVRQLEQAEANLRKSEEKFRSLVESSSDIIWEMDANGAYTYAGPKVKEILGYNPLQIIGKTPVNLMLEEDTDGTGELFMEKLSEKKPFESLAGNYRHMDGRVVVLETSAVPNFDQDGIFLGFRGIDRDITRRKETERLLREREETLESIFRAAPTGIGMVVDRVFVFANDRLSEMTGYSKEELIHKDTRLLYPDEAEYESIERKLASQISDHGTGTAQTRWKTRDNRMIEVLLNSTPLDVSDLSKGITFTALDITQRREAQKALAQSEERFRNVYETAPLAFVVWDINCRILQWNDRAKKMFGWSSEEAVGKNFFDLIVPEEDLPLVAKTVDNLLKGHIEMSVVNQNITKSNKKIWCEWNNSVIHDSLGRVVAAISLGLDISERKKNEKELKNYREHLEELVKDRTEALEAKNKELETFTYSVSHDLKAPLRGIDGYSRLLMEEYRNKLDEDGLQFLKNVRYSTERMNQLIEDLLAYSRVERREIFISPIDIPELVSSLLREREHDLVQGNIRVKLDLPFSKIQCDRDSMRQILGNLVDNAIKFTRDQSDPAIEISGEQTPENLTLWVKDNGVGFDPKYKKRIFGIFQRLHRAEEFPGTGVGLAIVEKAVLRLGGSIRAEGELGKGATFFLEIPKVDTSNDTKGYVNEKQG